jgi:hypothetical protein
MTRTKSGEAQGSAFPSCRLAGGRRPDGEVHVPWERYDDFNPAGFDDYIIGRSATASLT